MKVDGSAFKKAREKIRAENVDVEPLPSHPRIGTQEWLANNTGVSVRSVKKLEKGIASVKTVKAISQALGINSYQQYIIDYALECVSCSANHYIDFRPEQYPLDHLDSFQESVMLMTIDPLSIIAEVGRIDSFTLEEVTVKLTGLEQEIPFVWFAEVSLTNGMSGWLGYIRPIHELFVEANGKTLHLPIMLKQDNISRVLWREFIEMVEFSEKSQFNVEIKLSFARFSKQINIRVSTDLLKVLFQQGRKKYHSVWPYRAQLRTIC